jgi:hypothetical protein
LIEELVRAEEAEDCALPLFSTEDELNLGSAGGPFGSDGSEAAVGEVVIIAGGVGCVLDDERDLTRGKKCFRRADTECRGDR